MPSSSLFIKNSFMPSDLTPEIENPRRIRSFVKRAGRMTPSQEHALEHYWALYGLELNQGALDFSDLFGNDHPVIMEIGFGMGTPVYHGCHHARK